MGTAFNGMIYLGSFSKEVTVELKAVKEPVMGEIWRSPSSETSMCKGPEAPGRGRAHSRSSKASVARAP